MYVEDTKRGECDERVTRRRCEGPAVGRTGVYRQALETKAARIGELEAEVRYLRRLLNEMLAPKTPTFATGGHGRPPGSAGGRAAATVESLTVCPPLSMWSFLS
jgi:hypothetical protein